jgi:hypothetical protein
LLAVPSRSTPVERCAQRAAITHDFGSSVEVVTFAAFAVLVLALFVLLLLVACGRAPDVSVLVEGDSLRVHLSLLDKVVCCRGDLVVPLPQVEGIAAAPAAQVPRTGMRLPGTSLPNVIRAGSYGTGRARDLWDVRRGDAYLVVQLREGAPYRRVVLEVPDPAAEARRLEPVVASR